MNKKITDKIDKAIIMAEIDRRSYDIYDVNDGKQYFYAKAYVQALRDIKLIFNNKKPSTRGYWLD